MFSFRTENVLHTKTKKNFEHLVRSRKPNFVKIVSFVVYFGLNEANAFSSWVWFTEANQQTNT